MYQPMQCQCRCQSIVDSNAVLEEIGFVVKWGLLGWPNIALRPKLLKLHVNFSMFRRVVMKSVRDTFGKLLQ